MPEPTALTEAASKLSTAIRHELRLDAARFRDAFVEDGRHDVAAVFAVILDELSEGEFLARRRGRELAEDFARVIGVVAYSESDLSGMIIPRHGAGDPPVAQGRSSTQDALEESSRIPDDPTHSQES
jgi:hypothetical protein